MKCGFYIKLAKDGILKNRKFYFPYIVTCICMIMMHYIVSYISSSPDFAKVRGGEMLQALISVGVFVISVFSLIFLYYTNSFLVRRRQKEFGLYNILGMGKRNLVKILIWENVLTAVISIAAGLVCGILFSKMAELAVLKLLGQDAGFGIRIVLQPVIYTILLFVVIFALVTLRMLISVYQLRPVEMLKSENVGERPPKANWVVALVGFILLAAAYYLAVAVMDPMSAMAMFFVAVVMVIIATYLLFISGSVALCRILQKNKKYYYQTRHFVSLSSMVYRMKRNGAGLASICILSTMVLVTVSSTVCLFAQTEESIEKRYPYDIVLSMGNNIGEPTVLRSETDPYIQAVDDALEENDVSAQNIQDYFIYENYGLQQDDTIVLDMYGTGESPDYTKMVDLHFIALEDYNRISGADQILADNEVILYGMKTDYEYSTITLDHLGTWNVKRITEEPIPSGSAQANMNGSLFFVVKDISVIESIAQYEYELVKNQGGYSTAVMRQYGFDLDCPEEKQIDIYYDILEKLSSAGAQNADMPNYSTESRAEGRIDLMGINGGLFFLGILLGAVFIFGTVLIMYYKQISEGYEDQGRFDILMKVGMTHREVKKSINSQVLTVFFLPLVTAGVHLAFAFPLISKIMMLLSSAASWEMLLFVTACCYLVFALFYVVVYMVTSKSYYTIISAKREKGQKHV